MNRRALVAIPLALLFAYFAGAVVTHLNPWFFTIEVATVKLLAFIGCLAATVRYGRSDYLFWAWLLLGINYGALFLNDIFIGRRIHLINMGDEHLAGMLRTWVIVISNVTGAVSSVMMARTWRVAGIGLPSALWHKFVVALGIVVAVAVVGFATWPDLTALLAGKTDGSIVPIAANIGDLICFCVIAPLFLQTIALRGGTLAWPWALIVISDVSWMIFDLVVNRDNPSPARTIVSEACRCGGCIFAMTAGLAQRWATRARDI